MTSPATIKRGLAGLTVIVALALVPAAPPAGATTTVPIAAPLPAPSATVAPSTPEASISAPSTPVTAPVQVTAPTVTAPTATTPTAPSVTVPATPVTPPAHVTAPTVSAPTVPAPSTSITVASTPVTPTVHAAVPPLSAPSTPSAPVGARPSPSVSLAGAGAQVNAAPLGSSGGNATPSSTRGSYTAAAADGASAAGILSALFGPGVAKAGGASAAGDKRALEAARAAQISLHELVQRLSGCLSALTYELRLALEMSAGVGVSHAYAPAAIAAYLHVGMHRLSALEQRAVIALLKTARTSGCSAGTQSQDALALLTSLQPLFGAGPLAGAGGPEAFGERPLSHRSRLAGVAAATQDPLLGIDLSPEAETALIVLLAAGVTLLVGLLFSDRFEVGTRFRQWRFRRTHRPGA